MSVLVLGLGNDLLADDGAGLRIAQIARERLADEPNIVVRDTMEMGLSLLDEITGVDALVLVDSIQTGRAPPGHLHAFSAAELGRCRLGSPHFLGVGDTLALGRLLKLPMPAHVRIFAIEIAVSSEFGTALTPAIEAALPLAVEHVVTAARAFALMGAALPCHAPSSSRSR